MFTKTINFFEFSSFFEIVDFHLKLWRLYLPYKVMIGSEFSTTNTTC